MRRGSLLRVHHGVYRVGHLAPSREARYLAAVRACGAGAVLSRLAAAHLLGLIRGPEPAAEVTAPTHRRVAGVTTHRARRLHPDDVTIWLRIPVTSVARTIVELSALVPGGRLARACHEAGILHKTTPREVTASLARRSNVRGAATLRAILTGEVNVTLSVLERRFLKLLDEAGLPLPLTNRPAGTRRVDARWPAFRLTVELDSYRFHRSRHAWELDRRREREAHARGDEFRRYTYGDVLEDPRLMLNELRGLLSVRVPAEQS